MNLIILTSSFISANEKISPFQNSEGDKNNIGEKLNINHKYTNLEFNYLDINLDFKKLIRSIIESAHHRV